MANTPNYDIDYNDERFGKVESDREQALTELEQTYGGMIGNADQYYDAQIQASKDWADKQSQLQQDRTDFAIEQIEQQKDKAHKDYLKEQSGAYVDWRKQSNQYGVNAEQMAAAGLANTGFSESSQVSMYNTYQNRVATARESFNNAVLNYNNSIKDAQLQNNAALAEIAYQALRQQLELSLAGFQYKNQLILEQANKKTELDNMYYNRYLDVLEQINTENAMKEDIRQYNESMKWQTKQAELDRTFKEQQAALDRQFEEQQAVLDRQFKTEQAELERKHDKEMLAAETKAAKEKLQAQHQYEMAQLKKEQEYKMAQLDKQLANEKSLLNYQNMLSKQSYGSVGGSSGSVKRTSGSTSYGSAKAVNFSDTVGSVKGNTAVSTNYYQGAANKDCKYGTFKNGYQPDNVNGKKLKKTGDTVTFTTTYQYGAQKGQKVTVTQNVWEDTSGNKWYWDGIANKYKPFEG